MTPANTTMIRLLSTVCVAVFLAGCGGMPATVSGKVTIDGKAHPGLRVSFIPESGGATATCTTDDDGAFVVRTGQQAGLEPGEYRITVKGFSQTPGPMMTKEEVDSLRIVPAESSSREKTPHRATVIRGHNVVNVEI